MILTNIEYKKAEQEIIFTIEEYGTINAKTNGIAGKDCLNEVEKLLKGIAEIQELKKIDEWFKDVKNSISNKLIVKR